MMDEQYEEWAVTELHDLFEDFLEDFDEPEPSEEEKEPSYQRYQVRVANSGLKERFRELRKKGKVLFDPSNLVGVEDA